MRMRFFRHQPPAYSPLRFGALLRSTAWALRDGKSAAEQLREVLTTRFGASETILVGSGTQALQLALEHVRRKRPGQRVAIPAYSCFDVVTAVVGAGGAIEFYDIDPGTLSPDVDSLRDALRAGAGGVVVGNLYGFPLQWDVIREVCREHGAIIVEDAAQGVGSSWNGQGTGSFGDLTVLSFGRGKGWTGGSGGALLVRHAAVPAMESATVTHRSTSLREAFTVWAQWALGRPGLYGLPASIPWLALGETRYRPPAPLEHISGLAAATVCQHETAVLDEVLGRREAARRLRTGLENVTTLRVCEPVEGGESSFLRFPLIARSRDLALAAAAAGRKYGVARGYPTPLLRVAQNVGLSTPATRSLAGAEVLADRLITSPTHRFFNERERTELLRLLSM